MCLSCGCGQVMVNHGDPLQLTYGRLLLVASRLGLKPEEVAINILATLRGEITFKNPRGEDSFDVRITRIEDPGKPGWVSPPVPNLPLSQPKKKGEAAPGDSPSSPNR